MLFRSHVRAGGKELPGFFGTGKGCNGENAETGRIFNTMCGEVVLDDGEEAAPCGGGGVGCGGGVE